ncbi:MAG: type II toxin-antitoxin system VapC family toxin [Anaerolineae bacterium]
MVTAKVKSRTKRAQTLERRTVFIDTGAWIALYVADDANHSAAKAQWEALLAQKTLLVTSNYVIDEAITTVRAIADHAVAVRLGEALFSSRRLWRVRIDEELEREAWALFKRYDDQTFSFTDCTSFAVMRAEKIETAFAFDRDFLIAGFQTLP